LKFVEGYSAEDNVTVWKDLLSNLLDLSHILLNTSFHHELQSFVRRLLRPISKKLGWEPVAGESSLQAMCRATVLRALAINGDPDTIAECKRKFDEHLTGNQVVADLRSAVYSGCLWDADEALVDKFIALHNKTDLQEEKLRLATALGSVRKEELIQKVLDFAMSKDVRSQDSVTIICAVAGNTSSKLSSDLAWDYVKKNWSVIYARYSSGFLITRLVKVSFIYYYCFQRPIEIVLLVI
jgi:puromycin-sensitive aminopeptidase